MYYRRNRLSFYASIRQRVAWLRIRRADNMPRGFFARIGREV